VHINDLTLVAQLHGNQRSILKRRKLGTIPLNRKLFLAFRCPELERVPFCRRIGQLAANPPMLGPCRSSGVGINDNIVLIVLIHPHGNLVADLGIDKRIRLNGHVAP